MSTLKKTNFAKSILAASITDDDEITFNLASGDGDKFPPEGEENVFVGVFWSQEFLTPQEDEDREIVRCYNNGDDAFVIIGDGRGLEGTVAKAWSGGDNFALVLTAGVLEDMDASVPTNLTQLVDFPPIYEAAGQLPVTNPTADGLIFTKFKETATDEQVKLQPINTDLDPDADGRDFIQKGGKGGEETGKGGDAYLEGGEPADGATNENGGDAYLAPVEGVGTGIPGNAIAGVVDLELPTDAESGFLYIPSMPGTPTGVPAKSYTGKVPLVYDSINNYLYVYNGEWVRVLLEAIPE